MADNENTYSGWNWTTSPPLTENDRPASNDYDGDYFPVGPRYSGRVKVLRRKTTSEEKPLFELEALCTGGAGPAAQELRGKTFKTAFFMPLASELEGLDPSSKEYSQKTFMPRQFNAFRVACGFPPLTKDGESVDFTEMIGKAFDFTTRDYNRKDREVKDKQGNKFTVKGTPKSQIDQLYKPEATITADNEPLPAPASAAKAAEDFGNF